MRKIEQEKKAAPGVSGPYGNAERDARVFLLPYILDDLFTKSLLLRPETAVIFLKIQQIKNFQTA